MSNHTDLNVLLENIEERFNIAAKEGNPDQFWNDGHASCDDVPALVKALRRTIARLDQHDPFSYIIKEQITAILQASSEPKGEKEKDLEEPGA